MIFLHWVYFLNVIFILNLNDVEGFYLRLGRRSFDLSRSIRTATPSDRDTKVGSVINTSRVQRLKDICFKKEILNDLSSCEFALRLQFQAGTQVAKIDFENLLLKLDTNLDALLLRKDGNNDLIELEQRALDMKSQLIKLRDEASLIHINNDGNSNGNDQTNTYEAPQSSVSSAVTVTQTATATTEESDPLKDIPSINIVVRDDGTVDWDEAFASSREVAR